MTVKSKKYLRVCFLVSALLILSCIVFAASRAVDFGSVWDAMRGYFKDGYSEAVNPVSGNSFVDPDDSDLISNNFWGLYDGNTHKIVVKDYKNGYGQDSVAAAFSFLNSQRNKLSGRETIDESIHGADLYNAYLNVYTALLSDNSELKEAGRANVCSLQVKKLESVLLDHIKDVCDIEDDGTVKIKGMTQDQLYSIFYDDDKNFRVAYDRLKELGITSKVGKDGEVSYSYNHNVESDATVAISNFGAVYKSLIEKRISEYSLFYGRDGILRKYCSGRDVRAEDIEKLETELREKWTVLREDIWVRLSETETVIHELFHAHMHQLYPDSQTYNLFGTPNHEGFATAMTWIFARDESSISFEDYEKNFLSSDYKTYFENFIRAASNDNTGRDIKQIASEITKEQIYEYLDRFVGPSPPTSNSGNEDPNPGGNNNGGNGGEGSGSSSDGDGVGSGSGSGSGGGDGGTSGEGGASGTGGTAGEDEDPNYGLPEVTLPLPDFTLPNGDGTKPWDSIVGFTMPYDRMLFLLSGDIPVGEDFNGAWDGLVNMFKSGVDLTEFGKMWNTLKDAASGIKSKLEAEEAKIGN